MIFCHIQTAKSRSLGKNEQYQMERLHQLFPLWIHFVMISFIPSISFINAYLIMIIIAHFALRLFSIIISFHCNQYTPLFPHWNQFSDRWSLRSWNVRMPVVWSFHFWHIIIITTHAWFPKSCLHYDRRYFKKLFD